MEEFLQRDLDGIESKISCMAGIVDRALEASLEALTRTNRQKAYSVILRDQYIDEMETEVDRLCLEFLVRHQPVAGHLRFIFAAIQINRELERVGDFAESVARQALTMSRIEPKPDYTRFAELAALSRHMLADAMQAFLKSDADLARRTMVIEERANALRNSLNAEISRLSDAGKIPIAAVQPLLTVARRFEGVTDQAKNICEEALYMCTGEFTRHRGADTFKIVFLDAANSTLSQIAETIGRSLGLPRFVFSSAGLSARPVDARVARFLAGKGLQIPSEGSKTLEQLPGWEHSQVVITMGIDIPARLPESSKAIHLKWNVAQDIPPDAPDEEARTQIASAFSILESQIKELVEAVLEEPAPE